MISCSTLETWCACTGVWNATYLTAWSEVGCPSVKGRVSSPIPIESGPVKVHRNWDIIHTPWSIGRIVLRIGGSRLVGLVLISRAIIVTQITRRAIVVLESSSLIVIVALEVSKCSTSESSMRDEGGSISLSSLVDLGALSKNTL